MLPLQILEFVFGLAALIIVHEFGHYLAARMLKIEVEEFGIGIPPRLATMFKYKGTNFTLNAIPLGGFVRPKGENDPQVLGGLAAAGPWTRLGVFFAGPVMNLVTGILLGILFFYTLGDPILNIVRIEAVSAASPAEAAGLLPGDVLVSINGETIDSTTKVVELIAGAEGQPVELVYTRNGQNFNLTLTPRFPAPEDGAIGIQMGHPTQPVSLGVATVRGATLAYQSGAALLSIPFRIFSGEAAPEETRLVGYKGMFDIYQQIPNGLYFFMAISISLGILNLLPFPALDGGRIFLTLPEIIFRRRIPAQYENALHLIGFALLILVLIYVNVQDFVNPLQLP